MDVRIFSLTEKYYNSLEKIYVEIFGDFDSLTDQTNFRRYLRFRRHLIKIAVRSSKIIGCIIGDQDSSRKARIFFLYVLPKFQRRLIGTNLLLTLEKEFLTNLPGLQYISVRIPEEYFGVKDFFLRQGYNFITKINCYVKNDLSFPFQINQRLEIRLATEKDLEELIELEHACFSEYWRKTEEIFRAEMKSKTNILLVAFLDGKLVGYNSNSISANGINGHYARIATHPGFRKQHIAASLTSRAFDWFQEHKVRNVLLTTFAESEAHNSMYRNWGFKFEEQEVILAKKLI